MSHRIVTSVAAVAVAALVALLVAIAATPAGAAKQKPKQPTGIVATVLRDCSSSATGLLTRRYSARVLKLAKQRVRGDIAEYTGCTDAIKAQLRTTRATVVARVVRRAGGAARPGRVTLLHRGRVADDLSVGRGKSVTFKVVPGRYVLRADGRRRCVATVTAKAKKIARVAVVCR